MALKLFSGQYGKESIVASNRNEFFEDLQWALSQYFKCKDPMSQSEMANEIIYYCAIAAERIDLRDEEPVNDGHPMAYGAGFADNH